MTTSHPISDLKTGDRVRLTHFLTGKTIEGTVESHGGGTMIGNGAFTRFVNCTHTYRNGDVLTSPAVRHRWDLNWTVEVLS